MTPLRHTFGCRKIRVNSLNPGLVATEGMAAFLGSDFEKMAMSMTPLGRIAQTDDIAKVAVFLASDDSGWMTGERVYSSRGA